MPAHGTLIAAFLTRTNIFLASDGRVIDSDNGVVHDEWSKVYGIANRVGLLTAGTYLPHLRDGIVRNCQAGNIRVVEEVARIASLALQDIWQRNIDWVEQAGKLGDFKISVLVVGFDANGRPRVFHLHYSSEPRFDVKERPLFEGGRDLEVIAISTAGGQEEDPSPLLLRAIQSEFESGPPKRDPRHVLYSAFDSVKDQLSIAHREIGGKTFFVQIDWTNGYEDISDAMSALSAARPSV